MQEPKPVNFRCTTKGLIEEILEHNNHIWALTQPLKIMYALMREVANAAIRINDEELNILMLKLSLYSVAEPGSPDFDNQRVSNMINEYEAKRQPAHPMADPRYGADEPMCDSDD